MLTALHADGPYRDWRDALMTFGQFIGVWDMEVEYYDDSGQCVYEGRKAASPSSCTAGWPGTRSCSRDPIRTGP